MCQVPLVIPPHPNQKSNLRGRSLFRLQTHVFLLNIHEYGKKIESLETLQDDSLDIHHQIGLHRHRSSHETCDRHCQCSLHPNYHKENENKVQRCLLLGNKKKVMNII